MTDESNTKSAGQLLYEKEAAIVDRVPDPTGAPKCVPWASLSPRDQQRHEFNALAVPKNQTLKLP